MYILAELTGVVAETILAHIYFNGFFTRRSRPWWAMGSTYTVTGIILALLSFIPNASFLRLAFCAIALGLIAYLFFIQVPFRPYMPVLVTAASMF